MTAQNALLDGALYLAGQGWAVIPLRHVEGGKCSCGKVTCESYGKHPREVGWQDKATTDPDTIRAWWARWPKANIGVPCGQRFGKVMLGPDGERGVLELNALEAELGELPSTVRQASGTPPGFHLIFRAPEGLKIPTRKNHRGYSIDVRGEGGQFVVAPSRNICGDYAWISPPDKMELAVLPPAWAEWLASGESSEKVEVAAAEAIHRSALRGMISAPGVALSVEQRARLYLANCPAAVSGQSGHDVAFAVVRSIVYGFNLGPDRGYEVLQEWNAGCRPPWTEAELRHKCKDAHEKPYGKPRGWLLGEVWSQEKSGRTGIPATPRAEPAVPVLVPWPEPPAEEAFHGLAGKIVEAIDRHTEADPVAVLMQFVVFFGNAAGRNCYTTVGSKRHYPNLFGVLVGSTSKGRKGTSLGWIETLFKRADPQWYDISVTSGLSSGEGLINAVRDKKTRVGDGGEEEVLDDGAEDKRLLVIEEEFAQPLRLAGRDGNILSGVLRQAWDGGRLRTMTKASPLRATDAHISAIGHVTRQDLVRYLTRTDTANGFANRFLWVAARRSKLLPEGGGEPEMDALVDDIQSALSESRRWKALRRTDAAAELWRAEYARLSAEQPGIFGLVTSRAEAQVLRLSLVYAMLDECDRIDVCHVQAALALWDYSERSCRWVFGTGTGDDVADEILAALREAPQGLTLSQISELFHRNRPASAIGHALTLLRDCNLAREERRPNPAGTGRPQTVWRGVTS